MKSVIATRVAGMVVLAAILGGVCGAASLSGPDKAAKPALPIIPGAAGFGMETPAGSGRHLDVSLKPDWDKTLVAHWNFDGGLPAGGELTGDAALVKRGDGQALRVKGNGSLKLFNPKGYVKPGGSFTVMAWVYMEKPLGAIAENAVEGGGNWYLGHVRHGIQKWMFGAKGQDGTSMHAITVGDVREPQWRHVACVYDGPSDDMCLYIAATQVARANGKLVKGLVAAQSSHLTLGKGLTGLIDDVMFFGAALTQDQILALHASGYAAYLGANKTTVYKVTNLNTAGPGSLREALEAVGPRVVVFEVSGNIDFTPYGHLSISNPYITVAGQTAPSPGITLKGCELMISTHDVLLQHIRVRVGDLRDPKQPERDEKSGWSQWSERDCMKVDGKRIVIDHCSFSWATDENAQSTASQTTFRHNLFSEGLNSPKHHKGGHSKGLLILDQSPMNRDDIPEDDRHSRYVAVIGNLFAHNTDRNPDMNGGAKGVIVNNVVYDARGGPSIGVGVCFGAVRGSRGGGTWASVIGNHFDQVPRAMRLIARPADVKGRIFLDDFLVTYSPQKPEAGKRGVDDFVTQRLQDPWNSPHMLIFKEWIGKPISPEQSRVDSPPVVVPGLTIKPATEVRDWVLANAGARPADRDPVDARIVNEVRTRTGKICASQEDVGGWPKLAENRRELKIPDNPSGDDDGDGYTNLEQWLHGFADTVEGVKK